MPPRTILLIAGGLVSVSLSGHGCSPGRSDPAGEVANREDRPEYERAIARIRWAGGSVERDENAPGKPVLTVLLDGPRVTNEDLGHLASLVELQRLSLRETFITDDGLAHLKGLTQLRWLYLAGTW